MSTAEDRTNTPDYWSVSYNTFDMWVAELGYAAAGKLMAACAAYFLHGTEPDEIKLTKSARNMFEGERARLDRRRELAMKSTKGTRKANSVGVSSQPSPNVENSESLGKVGKKSRKNRGLSQKKPAGRQTQNQPSTSENANRRKGQVISLIHNQNPQTPAPIARSEPLAVGASCVVSPAELAALREVLG